MSDSYLPPSHNFLAPVPPINKIHVAPDVILDRLNGSAQAILELMKRGEFPRTDQIRTRGEFIFDRRHVRVGLSFAVRDDVLISAPRNVALQAVARQLRNIYN